MRLALEQALLAGDEVPVGAVLVSPTGSVIAAGFNRRELLSDPTSHAEIEVIRAAGKQLGDWRLSDFTLVVTLEPCVMCAGAIMAARIPRLVFGAWDEKAGACGSVWDLIRDPRALHKVEVVSGVLEQECAELLTQFFAQKR